jgi:hypothetical protein
MESAVRDSIAEIEHDAALASRFATKNLALGGVHTVDKSLATLFAGTRHVRELISLQVRFLSDALRHILDLSIGGDLSRGSSPDKHNKKSFRTGILGCGRIGARVAHALLDQAGVSSEAILVGTRQNDTTAARGLAARGVRLCARNDEATRRSRLVVLCCLPAQMRDVARSIAGTVRRSTVVLSCVPGYSATKIAHMLQLDSDKMVLRIGVQAPVNAVASALQQYTDPVTGAVDQATLCRFAGQALVPHEGDMARLHATVEAFTNFIRPAAITDEHGKPQLLQKGFSTRALVNQALFGSHVDPADVVLGGAAVEGKGELLAVEKEEIQSEARKAALAAWVGVCLSGEQGGSADNTMTRK